MTCIAKATQQDFADLRMMELAAKAAGLNVMAPYMQSDDIGWLCIMETGNGWSPLHDDGDALRLAAKLEMDICFHSEGAELLNADPHIYTDSEDGDQMQATRRAIVRAAAEIGSAME